MSRSRMDFSETRNELTSALDRQRGMHGMLSRKSGDGAIPEPISVRGDRPVILDRSPPNALSGFGNSMSALELKSSLPGSKLVSRPLSRVSSDWEVKSKAFKSLAQPGRKMKVERVAAVLDGLHSDQGRNEQYNKAVVNKLAETADFELIERTLQESESYLLKGRESISQEGPLQSENEKIDNKKRELEELNDLLKERKKSFLGEAMDDAKPKKKPPGNMRKSVRKTIRLDETPPKVRELRRNTDKIRGKQAPLSGTLKLER